MRRVRFWSLLNSGLSSSAGMQVSLVISVMGDGPGDPRGKSEVGDESDRISEGIEGHLILNKSLVFLREGNLDFGILP